MYNRAGIYLLHGAGIRAGERGCAAGNATGHVLPHVTSFSSVKVFHFTRPSTFHQVATIVVRELAAGRQFVLADLGETELRGFEDPVRLYDLR